MILLDEREVWSRGDMAGVEEFVMRQLGCENHRCAFFRSSDYVRFRVGLLYKGQESGCVYYERLCLRFERVGNVGLVRVFLNDDQVFEGSKHGWMGEKVEVHECERKFGNDRAKKRLKI